jgi:3-oxoacyl-[acyl-carrier-protein] synthase II
MRRVVITGVGLATPLGIGARATWEGLLSGRSAVAPVRAFDSSSLRTQLAAEIVDLDPGAFASARARRTMTRGDLLAVAGAKLAIDDAGLDVGEADAERTGLFLGGNKEISDPTDMLAATLQCRGESGRVDLARFGTVASSVVHPLFYVQGLQAAALFYISQAYGLKGTNTYFAGGAESGATAVGRAFRAVRRGEADVAVAGGFDDAVNWWNMSKLDATGMLSASNDRGAGVCRPYDRERDGTVLGEGAAFLVLEPMSRAKARGARAYAELAGFGSGFDAHNVVTPEPSGRSIAHAVRRALSEASVPADEVDYVAVHGSGTPLGDASEARALRTAFGASGRPAASSVKPATGHLVAGAGALNAAVATLAIDTGSVPATLNLDDLDPGCATADWVRGDARECKPRTALALARGVEGQSVALLLRSTSGNGNSRLDPTDD